MTPEKVYPQRRTFSGGVEIKHWLEMGECEILFCYQSVKMQKQ